ncbi:PucR family transcriptional regulator [Nocardioides yefusunii]|uniref:PucR family transcriptional regulator n=1 Tax=Nocardioides yefusunii TaxID=2500546 RepID=A0ABW1QUG2_9ACTN|nr:helix-turn-helix domain-containing protein [Nocardioides yefusunii]
MELRFGGVEVGVLLARRRRDLNARVLAGLAEEILTYREMPEEALNLDIVRAITLALDLFLDSLARGRLPVGEEWADLSESAARRAEEGVPLAAVLAAYHVGTRLIFEDVVPLAIPGDEPQVAAASVLAMRFLAAASEIVADRYLEERVAITDADADLSAERLRRVLDGDPRPEDAAPAHLVLRLALGEHPDEAGEGLSVEIAARRKLRRLRARLREEDDHVLGTMTGDGGLLVLLVRDGDLATAAARVPALVARLEAAAQAPLYVACTVAPATTTVASAAEIAEELLQLVIRLGRPPGTYRIEDVVVEYQMTRPGAARSLLAETVAPVAGRPELFETLRIFLRTGQDRRATAARLHVHPNTVDYRLNRVTQMLGIEVTESRNVVTLVGAMLAHGAEQGREQDGE